MRAKRIPQDEQLKLITECRQSGLSDYQWCRMHDIQPGTFYNWINRFRKRGITIPESCDTGAVTGYPTQEVVKLDEYYGAAEPPVRCGESHLSGLTEPPTLLS